MPIAIPDSETPVRIALKCAFHQLPYATIDLQRMCLIIESRHRGELCIATIPLLAATELIHLSEQRQPELVH